MISLFNRLFREFEPYRFKIAIDQKALCDDFHIPLLAGTPPPSTIFTAVSSNLFARSDERGYSRDVWLYEKLLVSDRLWEPQMGEIESSPIFYFRRCQNVYDFGLKLNASWWEEHSKRIGSSRQIGTDGAMSLGTFPLQMSAHPRWINEPICREQSAVKEVRNYAEFLERFGWEMSDLFMERLSHRYLVIWYESL